VRLTLALPVVGVAVWAAAAAIVPSFTDARHSLARTAKQVANGPKTPEEAVRMRTDLDAAVRTYLKDIGKLPTNELAEKLQSELRSPAYEVHAFELPRGMKIVEVDTVLNACDYLIIKDQSAFKVLPLPKMEVFDGGRIITESGAPVLVLVGHTAGLAARRPLIQAFAILPGDVVDETNKAVPGLSCEGLAKFASNNKDIIVDMSLWSAATGADLFKSSPNVVARSDDEMVRSVLKWRDGHYIVESTLGSGPLSPILAMACAMRNPSAAKPFDSYLGDSGKAFALANPMQKGKPLDFVVKQMPGGSGKRSGRGHSSYYVSGTNGAFQIDLKSTGSQWIFWGARRLSPDQALLADRESSIPEIKNAAAQPAPIVVATINGRSGKTKHMAVEQQDSNNSAENPRSQVTDHTASNNTAPAPMVEKKSRRTNVAPAVTLTRTDSHVKTAASTKPATVAQAAEKTASAKKIIEKSIEGTGHGARETKTSSRDVAQSLKAASANLEPASAPSSIQTKSQSAAQAKSQTPSQAKSVVSQSPAVIGAPAPGKPAQVAQGSSSKKAASAPVGLKAAMTLESLPSAPPAPAATKPQETVEIVDTDSAKLRSGPATDYRIVTELSKGTKLQVIGKQNGWYKVSAGGKEGYVYGGLVNAKKDDAYTTATVTRTNPVKDPTQKPVAAPKTGDHIVVLGGIHDGKYKVQLASGKIGYVDKDAIDVKVDAPQIVP
jgi:uncharacterized protein YraI